jgi:hypothetical protein
MSFLQKDLTHHSDDELFQMLKQHDKNALIVLFDRYAYDVHNYVKKIIQTHASGDPEQYDAQKVVLDIFTSLACYPPATLEVSLEYYLFDLAYYKAIQCVRQDQDNYTKIVFHYN